MLQDNLEKTVVETRNDVIRLIDDLIERLLKSDVLKGFDRLEIVESLKKISSRILEVLNKEKEVSFEVVENSFDSNDDQPDQTGKHPLWSTDDYLAAQEHESQSEEDEEDVLGDTSEFSAVPNTDLQNFRPDDKTRDLPALSDEDIENGATRDSGLLFIEEGAIRCTLDLSALDDQVLSRAMLIHMHEDFDLADYLGGNVVLSDYALDLKPDCLMDAVNYLPSIVDGYVSFSTYRSCAQPRAVREDYLKLMFLPDKFVAVAPLDLGKKVLEHGPRMLTFEELVRIQAYTPDLLKGLGVKDGVPVWVRTVLMDQYGVTFFGIVFLDDKMEVVLSTIPMMKNKSYLAIGY